MRCKGKTIFPNCKHLFHFFTRKFIFLGQRHKNIGTFDSFHKGFLHKNHKIINFATVMHRKVRKYIERNNLLEEGSKVIVALSGGADSVALLHVLKRLDYRPTAVHCNFHLRGEESMRDEQFVRELCRRLDVKLHVADFDTKGHAAKEKISIEMAARELRYTLFEKIRAEEKASAIAVAHHKDDTAETILLNLIRGTGIKGMHGIQARNGNIIRPLLCVRRDEVTEYLGTIGESYVTDSSNLSCDYTRNRIRLEIIPMMRMINPSIVDTLAENAIRFAEAEKIYSRGIEEGKSRTIKDGTIDTTALLAEPSPLSLLHEILSPLGFNGTQSEDIIANINGESGREYRSTTHTVTKDRDRLLVAPNATAEATDSPLPVPGSLVTPYGRVTAETAPFDGTIIKKCNTAMLDSSKLRQPLRVRNTKECDRFRPFGMKGSKLVSDYLTDSKIPLPEKRRQLVVVDADDRIVWLVNRRTDARHAITASTTNIIKLTWEADISE